QLMPHLTALENVMLPLELRGEARGGSRRTPRDAAMGASGMRDDDPRSGEDAPTRATRLLTAVGLASRIRHYPRVLSGGEQQRVALARAFVTRPAILFADEPTGSLDAATGQSIIQLMFEMNRAQGATLILVTHDLELARRCDRTIRIEAGRLRG
ncbi:MAG: ABC transporter ATP-binding protein, partial [Janthinobacterium lividum]